jgi:hypothetical protein
MSLVIPSCPNLEGQSICGRRIICSSSMHTAPTAGELFLTQDLDSLIGKLGPRPRAVTVPTASSYIITLLHISILMF